MALFKRGKVWWTYVTLDSVRHHKSTGTTNRKVAEAIERQFREELNASRHRLVKAKPEMTFGELAAVFLGEGMGRAHSIDRLNHILPFFSDVRIKAISQSTVRQFRQYRHEHKELKPATVNRDLSVLRRILYWGVDEGYLAANPLGRLRMERERRTKRPILSVGEEKLLLASAPEHLQRIILCALCTGMRRGEILGQQWEDVDLGNRLLNVSCSKTPEGEMREIPLASPLYALLKDIRKDRGPVFTFKGDAISIIKTAWVATLRRARLRHFRFHDLRHCFNTRLMMAGVMQEVRREILGHTHKSKDINDRYTHIELPLKCEAIAKLELWLSDQEKLLEADEHNDNYAPAAGPELKPKEVA